MKIDRLVSIIMILLERKKISASELAEMFEVTPRTIYRDIEAISLAGVPIVTYPGVNGGIGIMDEYKIDKKIFTKSDIATLLIGLSSISSTFSKEEIRGTLAKIKALLPEEHMKEVELKSNQVSIDLTPWIGNKDFKTNLEEIKKAMNDKKILIFNYFDSKGKKSNRKVEPYQLILKELNWYLQGYCISKQDFRVFKLSRISELKVIEESFITREFNLRSLGSWDYIEKNIIMIKLLVDESLREKMIEHCGEENIKTYKNNKLLIDFPFINDDFGYNLLLGFGNKCECLEPINIRKELIKRIKNMLDIYN